VELKVVPCVPPAVVPSVATGTLVDMVAELPVKLCISVDAHGVDVPGEPNAVTVVDAI
jgi:hypothetical protein